MKATFIHDFPVFIKNDEAYTFGGFPASIWKRYMKHVQQLSVICREKEAPKSNLNIYKKSSTKNVEIISLENYSSLRNLDKRRVAIKKIDKIIHESDFVILRLPSIIAIDAFEIVKKYKKPYIVEVVGNGYDAFRYKGNLTGKLIAPLIHVKMKKIVKRANSAIYVTERYLQKHYPNPNESVAITNAEISVKKPLESFNEDRLKLKNKINLKIGFLGTMNVKYKNFYLGLEFLQKYSMDNNINIDLFMAGGGENKDIDRLASASTNTKVLKVGKLENRERVDEWFQSLDLFIHPSITEGLPRVVLEAMNNHVPVIASSAGGTPEILKNEYIFDPKKYISFEKAMNNVLDTPVNIIIEDNYLRLDRYKKENLESKRDDFILNFIEREFKK